MEYLKFLADVNIEKAIVDFLRERGYDVLWIPEYDRRMPDEQLLNLANQENRILMTNDKDFGELMYFQKKVSRGIILFRIKGHVIQEKIGVLEKLLDKYEDKIYNHFVVLREHKIRFTLIQDIL